MGVIIVLMYVNNVWVNMLQANEGAEQDIISK
jgi:hypothetical protein